MHSWLDSREEHTDAKWVSRRFGPLPQGDHRETSATRADHSCQSMEWFQLIIRMQNGDIALQNHVTSKLMAIKEQGNPQTQLSEMYEKSTLRTNKFMTENPGYIKGSPCPILAEQETNQWTTQGQFV